MVLRVEAGAKPHRPNGCKEARIRPHAGQSLLSVEAPEATFRQLIIPLHSGRERRLDRSKVPAR